MGISIFPTTSMYTTVFYGSLHTSFMVHCISPFMVTYCTAPFCGTVLLPMGISNSKVLLWALVLCSCLCANQPQANVHTSATINSMHWNSLRISLSLSLSLGLDLIAFGSTPLALYTSVCRSCPHNFVLHFVTLSTCYILL